MCCGVREYIGIQWHTYDIYGTLVYSKHIYEWVHEYAMNIYANIVPYMAHIWVYTSLCMDTQETYTATSGCYTFLRCKREYIGIQWHTDDIFGKLVYSKHIYEWVHEYSMNIDANILAYRAHIWVYASLCMDTEELHITGLATCGCNTYLRCKWRSFIYIYIYI